MINSWKKGKTYELHVAKKIQRALRCEMRRTGAQEKWKSRSGDVNPKDSRSLIGRFHIEAKKHESWAILDWYKKAKDDAEFYKKPIVICSKNLCTDYVFLSLDDFLALLLELNGYLDKE